jgi:hypothetical protein
VLLLDDDDELPLIAGKAEASLEAKLGEVGIGAIDACILVEAGTVDQKVAKIIHAALAAGGFSPWDDGCVELHARRVIALVDAKRLQARGNLRKPRWSEVRLGKAG